LWVARFGFSHCFTERLAVNARGGARRASSLLGSPQGDRFAPLFAGLQASSAQGALIIAALLQ
jgi:hypothetical protein